MDETRHAIVGALALCDMVERTLEHFQMDAASKQEFLEFVLGVRADLAHVLDAIDNKN